MWWCFDICVGVLVLCVLVLTVFCIVCTVFSYCFVYVHLFLFVLSVLVKELLLPSENSIVVNTTTTTTTTTTTNNSNNNNNNVRHLKRLSLVCLPLNASYPITSYRNIIFYLSF